MTRDELIAQNEALQAENEALRRQAMEESEARRELRSLIGATEVAALFLDRDLCIHRFTPRVRTHFEITSGDAGRPLSEVAPQFEASGLEAAAHAALNDGEPRQREVLDGNGRWHLVHLRPYRLSGDEPDGVVLTFGDVTRQKQQQEELRTSTQQFQALVDASAQIVWQTDQEGRMRNPSRSWEAFTGQPPAKQLVYGWSDCVHEGDRERLLEEWESVVRAGGALETDFRLWHEQSGSWRWMATRGVPLREEDGSVSGYVGMNVDVTELREAKERVEQQLHTFGAALGSFEDFIYVFDLDGRFTYVNRPLLDLWGISAEEAFGKNFAELGYPPHLVALHQRQIAEVVETAGAVRDSNAYVSPTGVDGLYEYIFTPVLNSAGAVVAVAGVTRDVTEPRRAEAALRTSEERLRQALAVADMGTWSHEFGEAVTRFDQRAQSIFGFEEAERALADVPAYVHPKNLAELADEQDPDAPHLFTETHRIVRPDGSPRWVRGQTRVFHEDGADGALRPVRAVGVVVDVTEQQQAEEEVRHLTATLEDRVAARTQQVRRLTSLLASAEQEERRRIGHVLHDDLQQQLAGLSITLSLLQDADSDGGAYLHEQAQEILTRSLSLTRSLAAELSPPVLSETRLAPLLRWLAERHRTMHRLDVTIEVEEPCVVEDYDARALLYHSLREVLFNVVKHAGTDSAHLRAYTAGPYAVVEVQDEGVGFPSVDAGTRGVSDGFGLASVRERLHLAEGSLDIDSAPGRGTRVSLRVPTGVRPGLPQRDT